MRISSRPAKGNPLGSIKLFHKTLLYKIISARDLVNETCSS